MNRGMNFIRGINASEAGESRLIQPWMVIQPVRNIIELEILKSKETSEDLAVIEEFTKKMKAGTASDPDPLVEQNFVKTGD